MSTDFTPNEGTADVYVHEYAIPTLADQMTTDETTTTTTSCTLFNDERNVNTAKTCYEGCEGWCQKDTDKTDKATNEKRCDLSGDKCNSTKPCPTKLCSETNVTCTDDNDCAENETCRDVNQLCFGNIAPNAPPGAAQKTFDNTATPPEKIHCFVADPDDARTTSQGCASHAKHPGNTKQLKPQIRRQTIRIGTMQESVAWGLLPHSTVIYSGVTMTN